MVFSQDLGKKASWTQKLPHRVWADMTCQEQEQENSKDEIVWQGLGVHGIKSECGWTGTLPGDAVALHCTVAAFPRMLQLCKHCKAGLG